ncbi:MAG: tRNA (guanosine(37)-N1)-methyltransferase TrmD [Verrucomicrobia bacterium]|nr:tRNA (guanosine(37)-N1)-methyltransferase TrmD [Verrucomicrobiota bacterium]
MPCEIDVLSLFPEYFRGPLDVSMLKRAQEKGLISIQLVDIRDFSEERFRKVDDRPYGGGPGMVMMPDPVVKAIQSKKREGSKTIYLSPQGKTLTAEKCRELASYSHLILVCGHYEGIDQRVIDSEIDEEISIGDFVLTNGCLASIVLIDAVSRFIPGVLGDEEGADHDSFENGLLDWPHYTRPEVYNGMEVPKVLLSGNHRLIEQWRKEQAAEKTKQVRPDLFEKFISGAKGKK